MNEIKTKEYNYYINEKMEKIEKIKKELKQVYDENNEIIENDDDINVLFKTMFLQLEISYDKEKNK